MGLFLRLNAEMQAAMVIIKGEGLWIALYALQWTLNDYLGNLELQVSMDVGRCIEYPTLQLSFE